MRSTMQDYQLTIGSIREHGTTVHRDSEVVTATPDGSRSTSYGELAGQVARLPDGVRSIGITGDQRVATFQWNNAEHLASYLAVPSMGAVLHTLNIRLFPEQLTFVANEAEARVVLVDMSLAKQLGPVLPTLDTVHTVIAVGEGDLGPLEE